MRRQNFFRGSSVEKEINCSCGGKSKLSSRKNYPFGRNSKPVRTKFRKCKECGKTTILENEKGGKRR